MLYSCLLGCVEIESEANFSLYTGWLLVQTVLIQPKQEMYLLCYSV